MDDEEINRLHNRLLYETIAIDYLGPRVHNGTDFQRFRARCRNYVTAPVDIETNNCRNLLDILVKQGHITVGCYDVLKELVSFSAPLKQEIEDVERAINMQRRRLGLNRREPNIREEAIRIEELIMRIDFCDIVPIESAQYDNAIRQISRINRSLFKVADEIIRDPDLFREYTDACNCLTESLDESSKLFRLFYYLEGGDNTVEEKNDDVHVLYQRDRNEDIWDTCKVDACQDFWKNFNRLLKTRIALLMGITEKGASIRKLHFSSIYLFLSFESIDNMEKLISEYKTGALQKEVQEILITEDFLKCFALKTAKIELSIDGEDLFGYFDQQLHGQTQSGKDLDMQRGDIPTDEAKQQLQQPRVMSGIEEIRSLILPINESEADRIQIHPFKTDDTIGVDSIFVPISITDEYDKRSSSTTEEVLNQSLSPGGIFTVQSGKKARFVFMLGEAGYGKTVQCQRIAKSWCQAWKNENELGEGSGVPNYELKTSLKQFDLLVFVTMRDICSEHVNLTDMIKDVYSRYHLPDESLDDIVRVLKYGNYRSLVLLDGLDEWNIPDDKKQCLLDKCIPNCRDLPNSSVLISMRSWKFMEVEQICRASIDRVIRLNGLDEDGVKELTTNMLQNYFQNQDIEESKRRFDKVKNTISSASFELKSLMKIPLLAVFCILTLYEDIETGNSQTTFYLSIIEALIKRSIKKNQIEQPKTYTDILYVRTATGILQNYPLVSKYMPQLSRLGKVAFDSLTSKTSELVFSADQWNELLGDETVEFYLRVGLVTKSEISGKFHEDNVRISFLHKTIHGFLATLYIFYGRTVEEIEEIVQSEVINIDKALEYSPVLSFLGGLSPAVGCRISSFIKNLTNKDDDIKKYRFDFDSRSYQKMFYLYNLQLRCYKEARGTKSIEAFEDEGQTLKFSFSDVILLSTDTDVLTIRDSAEVMKFHPNDIISLNMVCIPNNDEEGISNAVVKTFLDESQSITSIYIDGYIDGKYRLIDEYSPKMFQLKTLGLSNVAFRDNILANLITKEESKEVIRALGILYLKSEEDEVIDFEYRIPSIHRRNTTKSGFRRYAYSKKTGANFGPQSMQRTPFLGKFLESLPDYKQLSTLHITYMEAEEDRQKLLQVLPKLNQLHDIAYSGSNRYPYPDYGYDATVISNITNLEKLQEVDLRSISLKESVLNFENMSTLKEITLDALRMHTANGWEMLFESFSKIETLQKIFLYDTNVEIEVLDEYKNIRGSVCIEKMDGTDV